MKLAIMHLCVCMCQHFPPEPNTGNHELFEKFCSFQGCWGSVASELAAHAEEVQPQRYSVFASM